MVFAPDYALVALDDGSYLDDGSDLDDRSYLDDASYLDDPAARAVIGDELRMPALWCEFGSCISRFTDPGALGECDVRERAHAAGWREDSVGRLACPDCVQHETTFMPVYPVARREPAAAGGQPGAAGQPATADETADAGLSRWDETEAPRLNLAWTAAEPGRSGWFRRHDAGRHRG